MCAAGGFAFLAYARNEKLLENGIRFALPLWNGQNGMLIALGAKTIQHTAINLPRRSKDEHVRNALQAGKEMWRISSVEDFRRSGCTVGGCAQNNQEGMSRHTWIPKQRRGRGKLGIRSGRLMARN